jgi:hypothetical protein
MLLLIADPVFDLVGSFPDEPPVPGNPFANNRLVAVGASVNHSQWCLLLPRCIANHCMR